jgi:hypothetical protein
MPTIWVCSAEISDSCTNLTVYGVRMQRAGDYVCPCCRPYLRRTEVHEIKLIILGHNEETVDGKDD